MKRLDKILKPSTDNDLADFVRRARDMDELTSTLVRGLRCEARHAIVAANLRDDGTLVLLASSPGWAARLRYAEDEVRDAAAKAGLDVHDVRVRVARTAV